MAPTHLAEPAHSAPDRLPPISYWAYLTVLPSPLAERLMPEPTSSINTSRTNGRRATTSRLPTAWAIRSIRRWTRTPTAVFTTTASFQESNPRSFPPLQQGWCLRETKDAPNPATAPSTVTLDHASGLPTVLMPAGLPAALERPLSVRDTGFIMTVRK